MDDEQTFSLGQLVKPKRYPDLGSGNVTVIGVYEGFSGRQFNCEYLDNQGVVRTEYFRAGELASA